MSASVAGRFALVKMAGDAVAMTDEAMETTLGKVYQIVDTLKTVWDPSSAITVKIDGVTASPTGGDPFTINRLTGQVIFDTLNLSRDPVTVSGNYRPLSVVAKAKSYTHTFSSPAIDDTTFDSDGWRENIPNIVDFSASLGRNVQEASTTFFDAIANGTLMLLEFWDDRRANFAVRAWGFITKDDSTASTDSVIGATMEFRATQDADKRVASVVKADLTAPVYLFPTSIAFDDDPASHTLTSGAPTFTPTPHVYDQHGDELDGDPDPTSWSSSNTGIATVNTSTGLITRVANGRCRIYAHYGAVQSPPFRILCTT